MKPRSSRRRTQPLLPFLLLLCIAVPGSARTHRKSRRPVKQGKPTVQQVSPPNWWSALPDPMLLLQGKNLIGAHVNSSAPGISVRRTRISANGHWAFVWLDIAAAPPQHFDLLVRTASGQARVPYELDKRHEPTDGFQGFSSADVMYLIVPDRFANSGSPNDEALNKAHRASEQKARMDYGGGLSGITKHLDYLQQLGVTTVGITALYTRGAAATADNRDAGAVDLYRVDPKFGTLQDYQALAQALHSRGMKFVLDLAPNDVNAKNAWVLDPPAPDWFHGTLTHHLEATEDFGPITDPHAASVAYRSVLDGWIGNTLPDLNQSNPLVRDYLIQNTIWWIESGALDGLRYEAYAHVERTFWQELHTVLHALYPRLTAAGEISSTDPTIVSYFAGGVKRAGIDTGLYTPDDFPVDSALRTILAGTSPTGDLPMTNLTGIQRLDWLYPHPERLVTSFDDADTARFLSEPGATAARLKLAFGLLATMRGMPQIYFGDEIGLVADGGAQDIRGFSEDKADPFTPNGRTPQQEAMHAWVQGLLQLRAHHTVFQTGTQQNLLEDDTGFVFARVEAPPSGRVIPAAVRGEVMLVLMNKSEQPRTFHLDFLHTALQGMQTLAPEWNTTSQQSVVHNKCDVEVGAEQLVVFSAERQELPASMGEKSPPPSAPPLH